MSLSEQDYLGVLSGIERLNAADSLDDLAHKMVDVVSELINCDTASYTEADSLRGRAGGFMNEPWSDAYFKRHHSVWAAHMLEHPVLTHFLRNPLSGPRKISDFLDRSAYHRLGLYGEYYEILDTEFQLAANVSAGADWSVGLVVNRSVMDFSERDREVLALLQPHIRRCYGAQRRQGLLVDLEQGRLTEALHENLMRTGLTRREAEVLFYMAIGKSNGDIAVLLDISVQTVKQHVRAVLDGLGLSGRAAAMLAIQREVLSQDFTNVPPAPLRFD